MHKIWQHIMAVSYTVTKGVTNKHYIKAKVILLMHVRTHSSQPLNLVGLPFTMFTCFENKDSKT